ncbi:MAG: Fe-S cluster assembly protein SufD [Candidatus Dormibacteria bacterium]
MEARATASPPWLAARRRAAWDAFGALPMPRSAVDEDYRRTDIGALRIDRFSTAASPDGDDAIIEAMRKRRDAAAPEAAWLANTATGVRAIEGADALAAQGVIVCSLEVAADRHAELLQRGLASLGAGDSKFIALWNALWQGGCFVYVPKSVDAAIPLWVTHVASAPSSAIFPATVALLDDNSSLTLFETYASPAGDQPLFSDAVTALWLGRDARLDYCTLQQWGGGAWHVATHRAGVGANAQLRFFGATLGARLQKVYWDALLEGQGAAVDITGVCFGDRQQHLDHQSLQAHRAPQTHSDLLLKVAVRDQARSVYSGLVDVDKVAQQTDGYVANRNLILGHGAKADSVPRLEIRANDVRCGHGATAGHIDDEQRFYLQSRGVPREDADRLIVRGFMEDALARVPHAGFATLVGRLMDEEIAGHAQLGVDADGATAEAEAGGSAAEAGPDLEDMPEATRTTAATFG